MKHISGTPWTLEKIKYFLAENNSPYAPKFSKYLGQKHEHEWACSICGSTFIAHWKRMWKTVRGIHKGGCLKCAKRLNYTIDQVHQELKDSDRPIQCLSETYKNNKAPMTWKCLNKGCDHVWKTGWKNIKGSGKQTPQGCVVCANNVKYTLEKIKEVILKDRLNLTLKSTVYENNTSPLIWNCNTCNQDWKASWASVNCMQKGCPYCATLGKTEDRIGVFLNKVFNEKFVKIRPDFLKNPKTGRNLEIDLYSSSLNLAIEVNGQPHYIYNPYFHKSHSSFKEIQRKDKWKKKKLKDLRINFIELPIHGNSLKKIKNILKKELILLGYEIPKEFEELKIV